MTGVDLHVLPTHPYLGDRAGTIPGQHVDTEQEALQVMAAMANGQHYEARPCDCEVAP